MCHIRPVSDGGVLPQAGAERGDLLGQLLHPGTAITSSATMMIIIMMMIIMMIIIVGLHR